MKKIIEYLSELKNKCISSDDEAIERFSITQSEYQFFLAMDKCVVLSSSELAAHTGLSPSRTSRVVDLMVTHGFLSRETSLEDRRAIVLKLTENGADLADKIRHFRMDCESKFQKVLSESEILDIKKSLDKVLTIL